MSPVVDPFCEASPSRGRVMRRSAAWAPAALLALGGLALALAVQLAPGDGVRLVAVFPPWWSQAQAIAAAAQVGPVTGVSKSGFAVGVVATRPGVAAALRAQGALFVADGRAFPACFPSSPKGRTP